MMLLSTFEVSKTTLDTGLSKKWAFFLGRPLSVVTTQEFFFNLLISLTLFRSSAVTFNIVSRAFASSDAKFCFPTFGSPTPDVVRTKSCDLASTVP